MTPGSDRKIGNCTCTYDRFGAMRVDQNCPVHGEDIKVTWRMPLESNDSGLSWPQVARDVTQAALVAFIAWLIFKCRTGS